jgi:hypothetical protein
MIKKIGLLFLLWVLMVSLALADTLPPYLYVMKDELDSSFRMHLSICKIDTKNDQIVEEVRIKKGYDDLFLNKNGDLFMSDFRGENSLYRRVDVLEKNSHKTKTYLTTRGKGAMRGFFAGNYLYVLMFSPAEDKSVYTGLEKYLIRNGKPYFQKTVLLGKHDRAYSSQVDLSLDGKYVYVTTYEKIGTETENLSKIFKVDIKSGEVASELKEVKGMAHNETLVCVPGERLYVYGSTKGYGRNQPPNRQVQVYSAEDLSFIKSIDARPRIYQLLFAKDINKVFGFRRSDPSSPYIDLFDVETDKMIGRILVGYIWDAVYAGNGKIYATEMGDDPGLLVIDIKQRSIVKKIPGSFTHLSYPSYR